jgi:ribose transport system substrate-binding protein
MRKALVAFRSLSAATFALLITAGVLAGCGSSSSSTGANAAAASDSHAAGASASPELARAEANLRPWLTPPKTIAVTQPLKRRITGALLDYLECSAGPCQLLAAGLRHAASDMGARLKVVPAGATPESFQAAAQQAIRDQPAAIVMPSLDPSLLKAQLAAMKANHILRVGWATASDPPGAFDLYFLSPASTETIGKALGDYAIVHTNGNAHVLYVNQSAFSGVATEGLGLKAALAADCKKCTYTTIDTLPQDVGTKIPTEVVSTLQANPSINWVDFGYGAMTLGVPQALSGAGLNGKVAITTASLQKNNYLDLKTSAESAGDDLNDEFFAYYAIDSIARALTGQSVPNLQDNPFAYIITAKDVTFNPNTGVYDPIPGFQQQFRTLWGVK